jgi:predicted NAD/FAD-binding protein
MVQTSEFFNYDKVVLASHADESLKIISDTTNEEKEILSNFKYKPNKAIIHSDESVMPKNKKAWCSWNSSLNIKILNNRQLLIGLINYKILKLIKIYF